MSITHDKNLSPLLNLIINCIYTRCAPQILSIKDACTFLLLSSRIIGLCNSSANCLFEALPLREAFLSNYLSTIEASPP